MGQILASVGGALEGMEASKRGIVVSVFLLAAGVAVGMTLNEYVSHEPRLAAVEEWIVAHEDTLSVPGMALAESNAQAVEGLEGKLDVIQAQVNRLFCLEFPGECEGVPR